VFLACDAAAGAGAHKICEQQVRSNASAEQPKYFLLYGECGG